MGPESEAVLVGEPFWLEEEEAGKQLQAVWRERECIGTQSETHSERYMITKESESMKEMNGVAALL